MSRVCRLSRKYRMLEVCRSSCAESIGSSSVCSSTKRETRENRSEQGFPLTNRRRGDMVSHSATLTRKVLTVCSRSDSLEKEAFWTKRRKIFVSCQPFSATSRQVRGPARWPRETVFPRRILSQANAELRRRARNSGVSHLVVNKWTALDRYLARSTPIPGYLFVYSTLAQDLGRIGR